MSPPQAECHSSLVQLKAPLISITTPCPSSPLPYVMSPSTPAITYDFYYRLPPRRHLAGIAVAIAIAIIIIIMIVIVMLVLTNRRPYVRFEWRLHPCRWTLNGWTPEEIAGFALAVAVLSPLVVSGPRSNGAGLQSSGLRSFQSEVARLLRASEAAAHVSVSQNGAAILGSSQFASASSIGNVPLCCLCACASEFACPCIPFSLSLSSLLLSPSVSCSLLLSPSLSFSLLLSPSLSFSPSSLSRSVSLSRYLSLSVYAHLHAFARGRFWGLSCSSVCLLYHDVTFSVHFSQQDLFSKYGEQCQFLRACHKSSRLSSSTQSFSSQDGRLGPLGDEGPELRDGAQCMGWRMTGLEVLVDGFGWWVLSECSVSHEFSQRNDLEASEPGNLLVGAKPPNCWAS